MLRDYSPPPRRTEALPSRKLRHQFWNWFLAALLTIVAATPAMAASSAWAEREQLRVRLIAATEAVGEADTLRLGLEFALAPGWKTYWRSPGDAGYPIAIDWRGSTNLADASMLWPAPHRFQLFGLETFGYQDEVVLPIVLRPETPGEPMRLRAHLRYLVCEEICIPYEETLSLDLPAGVATPAAEAQLIDRYLALVPGDGRAVGLAIDAFEVEEAGGEAVLRIRARSDLMPFEKPDAIVEGPAGYGFSAPEVALGGQTAALRIRVSVPSGATPIGETPFTVTMTDGVRAMEAALTPVPVDGGLFAGGFIAALVAALLGGFILNVMPCVLPVLAMKLGAVLGLGGAERAQIRVAFLATAAGVVAAFLVLAAALIGLKAGGAAIGWGVQFQQPLFLAFMALLVTLFAANLMGLFDIPLPGWAGALGARPFGQPRSRLGDFATGALATLLATPCSAPFVGTAVGFALARGPGEILAIFLALGIGLAAPYLLVAAMPALVRFLPKPGRWMTAIRAVLAFALLGTAIWLVSILAGELGDAVGFAIGMLLLVLLLGLLGAPRFAGRSRLFARLALVVAALGILILPVVSGRDGGSVLVADGSWQRFEESRIPGLVGDGKVVFVDVTAEWCVTCLANKRLVLESAAVRDELARTDTVAMQADWTSPDSAIQAYLARHGRYGIPFNAVYGPAAPDGILLPELLTREAVLTALRQARGGPDMAAGAD